MDSAHITKTIYAYVADNFGQSEADNPSWNIEQLAQHLEKQLKASAKARARLDHLSAELDAERISYGELSELTDLVPYMEGDMRLLEAAGVPEDFANRQCKTCGDVLPQKQHDHRPEITLQFGWYCCDEYFCSTPCVNASFDGELNEDGEPLTWEEHYSDDGDCYFTEWESEV